MVGEQRCPECGAPVATGAPYCPNGHAIAWREESEDRTTDLGGADRGQYGDEALVTRRMAGDQPDPRDERGRGAPATPTDGGPVGVAGVGVGGGERQRVRRGPNPAAIVLGVLLLGVLAGAGWYFVNARGDGAAPAGAATTSETATATTVPSGSASPSATEPDRETYEIQAGDSLSGIAAQFNTTVEALAAENEITDINRITVGQVLTIPPETGTASP